MKHAITFVAVLLAACVEPASARTSSVQLPVQQMAVPSAPPAETNYTPAPVPNEDLYVPSAPRKPTSEAEFTPGLMQAPRMIYRGEGYTRGSTMTDEQTRKLPPVPGLNLRVPLE